MGSRRRGLCPLPTIVAASTAALAVSTEYIAALHSQGRGTVRARTPHNDDDDDDNNDDNN